jgi:hypothetical protein
MSETGEDGGGREVLEALVGFGIFVGGLFGGIFLIFYQIFLYLKFGAWTSFSLNYVIAHLGVKYQLWTEYPSDWIGLHSIFELIPLSLTLIVSGLFIGGRLMTSE